MRVVKVARKKVNVEGVAFSPNGAQLAVRAENVDVGPWDVQTGEAPTGEGRPGLRPGGTTAFHPSGRWLFGTSAAGYGPAVYDLDTCDTRMWQGGSYDRVGNTQFTPDGATLLHSWHRPPTNGGMYWESQLVCRPWAAGAPTEPTWATHPYPDRPERAGYVTGFALLPDGERFATADYASSYGARVTIRSLRTGAILTTRSVQASDTIDLAVSPTGAWLVVRKGPYLVAWENSDLGAPGRNVAHNGRKHFTDLAFHPSGKYLAATSNDETVKLYDTTTWELARTFTWTLGRMRSVCFSADGTLAAAGSDTGNVVVWDVDL